MFDKAWLHGVRKAGVKFGSKNSILGVKLTP
jgi:hypothetical protein